jgi:hypothetical protein
MDRINVDFDNLPPSVAAEIRSSAPKIKEQLTRLEKAVKFPKNGKATLHADWEGLLKQGGNQVGYFASDLLFYIPANLEFFLESNRATGKSKRFLESLHKTWTTRRTRLVVDPTAADTDRDKSSCFVDGDLVITVSDDVRNPEDIGRDIEQALLNFADSSAPTGQLSAQLLERIAEYEGEKNQHLSELRKELELDFPVELKVDWAAMEAAGSAMKTEYRDYTNKSAELILHLALGNIVWILGQHFSDKQVEEGKMRRAILKRWWTTGVLEVRLIFSIGPLILSLLIMLSLFK